jgi:carbon starvation protein CstA
MTEQETIKRKLRLIRYGGVVVTVTVLVVLLAFAFMVGQQLDQQTGFQTTGTIFSNLLIYIIGFTVFAAVLSIVVYFAYRAYLMSRAKS